MWKKGFKVAKAQSRKTEGSIGIPIDLSFLLYDFHEFTLFRLERGVTCDFQNSTSEDSAKSESTST